MPTPHCLHARSDVSVAHAFCLRCSGRGDTNVVGSHGYKAHGDRRPPVRAGCRGGHRRWRWMGKVNTLWLKFREESIPITFLASSSMASSETRAELVCARTPEREATARGLACIGRAVCASRDSCRGRNRSRR